MAAKVNQAAQRYTSVDVVFAGVQLPAISRIEADRAARRLVRKFGPHTMKPVRVRRCWIALQPTNDLAKGWRRLIHDVSHLVFRRLYPNRPPHHPAHALMEMDVAQYVMERGWATGKLAPKKKPKATLEQKRAVELKRTIAALARWETKRKRATTAIAKLSKRKRYLERFMNAPAVTQQQFEANVWELAERVLEGQV